MIIYLFTAKLIYIISRIKQLKQITVNKKRVAVISETLKDINRLLFLASKKNLEMLRKLKESKTISSF